MGRSRLHLTPALLLLTLAGSAQEPLPHPMQEDRDLHNSTILPLPDPVMRKELTELEKALEKRHWPLAGRLLVKLSRRDGEQLIKAGHRGARGLLEQLAAMALTAPPALHDAIRTASRDEWEPPDGQGPADPIRLTELIRRNPLHPDLGPALLRLADLHLEAGRPDACASILRRLNLLPRSGDGKGPMEAIERRRRALVAARALISEPWPVPRGSAGGPPPSTRVETRLAFTPLEWQIRSSREERAQAGHRDRYRDRGLLQARGRMVICAGQVCFHSGRYLWRLDPTDGTRLAPPRPLADADTRPLPCALAASGDRLALIRGPRPGPGEALGDHFLECHLLTREDPKRDRILWSHPGRLPAPLPATIRPQDRKALTRGPLIFGRGPVWLDGDLLVSVFAPLDKTKVSAFLVRLAGDTGRPRWVRFLAQGAPEAMDPRVNRLATMPFPEVTGAPLCLHEGALFMATDLGTVHAVDAWDGRPLWAFRVARTYPEPGLTMGCLASTLSSQGDRVLAGLKDSNWLYLFRTFPVPGGSPLLAPPLPRRRLNQLIGVQNRFAYFIAGQEDEYYLERIELPTGRAYQAPPLQSGEYFSGPPIILGRTIYFSTLRRDSGQAMPGNGYLYRADLDRDLYLELAHEPRTPLSILGPLLPWQGGLISAGYQGFGIWRPLR